MSDQSLALTKQPSPPADQHYDSIHAAVMETARGRWFLGEYVRRNRNADTGTLLAAIGRIESLLKADSLLKAKGEETSAAAADGAGPAPVAQAAGGAVETASAQLLMVRDHIHQVAESLVECGAPSFLTNDLKRHIAELSAVCKQLGEIVQGVPVEAAPPVVVPALEDIIQGETLQTEALQDEALAATAVTEPPRDPFADIRALSAAEKIALFT